MRNIFCAAVILSTLILSSCIGIAGKITLRRDGSGTINLEYAMSREFFGLGQLDGNSSLPLLPAGAADLERSAARIPGLNFRSGSVTAVDDDVAVRGVLDFENPAALAAFFDGLGVSGYFRDGEPAVLSFPLSGEPERAISPTVRKFAGGILEGRYLELSLALPSEGELYLADGEGDLLPAPPGWIVSSGKNALFRAPLGELLTWGGPLSLIIRWNRS